MKRVIFILIALLTTSCSMWPTLVVPITIKERVAVGSIIKLNQEIEIPQGRSFIYIQNGNIAPIQNYNAVDIYTPYCMLYINHEARKPHIIKPDRFEITKVIEWEGYQSKRSLYEYAKVNSQPGGLIKTSLASRSLNIGGGLDSTMYATILSLRSAKQPKVKQMVCGRWDDPTVVTHLTFGELKSALGDLMTIEAKVN